MAVTVAECEQMIAAAKENHIKLMIAYRLHLDAANMEAVEVIKSGQIGEPRFFNSIFAQQTEQNNSRMKAVTIVGSATVVTCRSIAPLGNLQVTTQSIDICNSLSTIHPPD